VPPVEAAVRRMSGRLLAKGYRFKNWQTDLNSNSGIKYHPNWW